MTDKDRLDDALEHAKRDRSQMNVYDVIRDILGQGDEPAPRSASTDTPKRRLTVHEIVQLRLRRQVDDD